MKLLSMVLTLSTIPFFAQAAEDTVELNAPIAVTDPTGATVKDKHVDVSTNGTGACTHADREKGKSRLTGWTKTSGEEAWATIKVRIGDDNATPAVCEKILLVQGGKAIQSLDLVIDKESCTAKPTY